MDSKTTITENCNTRKIKEFHGCNNWSV